MLNNSLVRPSTFFLLLALGAALLLALNKEGISSEAELAVVAGAVAVGGLPHGAADGWIAFQWAIARDMRSATLFFLSYISLAILVIVAWQSLPIVCLLGFLGLSAWHFGDDSRIGLGFFARMATGVIILSAPAVFSSAAVVGAYQAIAGEGVEGIVALQQAAFWAACALLPAALTLSPQHSARTTHLLDLCVMVSLAALLSPLLYFAVYFCGIHSPRHLGRIVGQVRVGRQRPFWLIVAALTLVAALAGIVAFLWLAHSGQFLDVAALQTLFIGLAALTLPHMMLVDVLPSVAIGRTRNDG